MHARFQSGSATLVDLSGRDNCSARLAIRSLGQTNLHESNERTRDWPGQWTQLKCQKTRNIGQNLFCSAIFMNPRLRWMSIGGTPQALLYCNASKSRSPGKPRIV